MPGPEVAVEKSGHALEECFDVALHALCQPLTVLQCRLAMGELIGEPEAMREAIHEALQECRRLNETISAMRVTLQKAMQRNEDNERER